MPMNDGSISKMQIVAYTDKQFSKQLGEPYTVMLNPESINWNRSVQYNDEQAIDSSAPSQKYKATPSERVSFDLIIDCSGVVDSERIDLPSEINDLSKVVYTYNGGIHRPNYVKICWGGGKRQPFPFQSVLTRFDTIYTYFRPDGTALRAKISLEFCSYIDPVTRSMMENKKSPDITHLVNVVEGDTLPQISQRMYNNPDYYIQLASSNSLNKFRYLLPGSCLTIPPLVPAERGGRL